MTYRNIEVGDKEYQYTISTTHVKIRGMEAVLKERIGSPRYDECGSLEGYTVTPNQVRQYILRHQK